MDSHLDQFGYLAILVGTFLEGETILILGGFAAHRGYLDLPLVLLAAFIGTFGGDQLFYFLGHRHSQALLARRPRWQPRIDKARRLIHAHRTLVILSFRFIYGLRTVIPFTLGLAEIPLRIFLPLNLLGALLWSVAIGVAGYWFGHALEIFFGHLKELEPWIMGGIVLIGVIAWFGHWALSRR